MTAVVLGTTRGSGSRPHGSKAMSVKVSTGGGALGNEALHTIDPHFCLRTDARFFSAHEEDEIISILGTQVFLL